MLIAVRSSVEVGQQGANSMERIGPSGLRGCSFREQNIQDNQGAFRTRTTY